MKSVTLVALVTSSLFAQTASDRARELSQRAGILYSQSHYAEAEPLYRQALQAWKEAGAGVSLNQALDQRNLGAVLRASGRYQEAEPLLVDALRQLDAASASPQEIMRTLINLSSLYRAQGKLAQAESDATRAVALADAHPDMLAAERQAPRLILGSIYVEQRRFNEAEVTLNAALENADGAIAVGAYNGLTSIAIERNEFARAESYAKEALRFARLALPAGNPAVSAAWNNYAQACRFEGNYLEAENGYRRAIENWEAALGPSHPTVANGLMNLAALYHERGRETGAEDLYTRAANILDQAFGAQDARTLTARNELAEVLRAEHRYTEAEKLARSTLTGLEKSLPQDDPRLVRAESNYSRLKTAKACMTSCKPDTAQ